MGAKYRRIAGVRYRVPLDLLPVERTVHKPGYFTFGLPWPWEEVDASVPILDPTGPDGVEVLAQAFCPRTDGLDPLMVVWQEDTPMDFNRGRKSISGAAGGGSSLMLIGGARAIVTEIDAAAGAICRVDAEYEGTTMALEFLTPVGDKGAYLPHLETILATWDWA